MNAMPTPPNPEDFNGVAWLLKWLSDSWASVFGSVFGMGGIGFAWRASSRIAKFEATQEEHGRAIAELKSQRAEMVITVATLATKSDLSDATSDIKDELRAGMSNMMQLISTQRQH